MNTKHDNVILIGMSGAGKSTLGVLLAKAMGKNFFDTDILIQQSEGKLLQEILDEDGMAYFLEAEERIVSSLNIHGTVIATGGSVVYSDQTMRHLRTLGTVVYLEVGYGELAARLSNIKTRGIVFKGSADLEAVYRERLPLYEKYADLRVTCDGQGIEACVEKLLARLA